jgi:hypothetical protein
LGLDILGKGAIMGCRMTETEIENWVSEIIEADPLIMAGVDPEFEAWWNEVVELDPLAAVTLNGE